MKIENKYQTFKNYDFNPLKSN